MRHELREAPGRLAGRFVVGGGFTNSGFGLNKPRPVAAFQMVILCSQGIGEAKTGAKQDGGSVDPCRNSALVLRENLLLEVSRNKGAHAGEAVVRGLPSDPGATQAAGRKRRVDSHRFPFPIVLFVVNNGR